MSTALSEISQTFVDGALMEIVGGREGWEGWREGGLERGRDRGEEGRDGTVLSTWSCYYYSGS